jgi:hypothetical protein
MRKTLLVVCSLLLASTAAATVPDTDLYVPAVGHGLGQTVNGVQAMWRSDVWIFNPSTSQSATVYVYMLLRDHPGGNTNPDEQTITVNPGQTRYLQDVVGNGLFNLNDTYGGLRIVSSIPVVVSGRSYDANVTVENKPQGTAGQFFSGVPATSAIGLGDSTDIVGLDQDGVQTSGDWRSNLAFVETTGNPVDLTITLLDTNGTTFGSPITKHLDGRQVSQINYIISAFGTTGSNQRIHVAVTNGSGRIITNASRMDNRTGDPATIEMVGEGREGTYVCKQDKTSFDTPITLTVAGGAITAVDATIIFTSEDVPSCSGGELLLLSGPLPQPVFYDDSGGFSFVVSNPNVDGLGVSLQINGTISVTGQVSGTAMTTLTGAGACSGSKSWPLVGAKTP